MGKGPIKGIEAKLCELEKLITLSKAHLKIILMMK